MVSISVCIIGKNEEENIEKCLEPLTHYPFEIIYVDTGSTDRTKELAAKYTDKIYDFTWIGDFSAARNFSLEKASHNYVLVLDCDEHLTALDLDGLCEAIETAWDKFCGRVSLTPITARSIHWNWLTGSFTNALFTISI